MAPLNILGNTKTRGLRVSPLNERSSTLSGLAKSATQAGSTRQPDYDPSELSEWLSSPMARRFEGKWVLLTDDFHVIDSAQKPSDLYERNQQVKTPFIVYVDHSNVNRAL